MAFCVHPVKMVLKLATSQSTVSQQQPMSQKPGVKSHEQAGLKKQTNKKNDNFSLV